MKLLLDTNVVSEPAQPRPDPTVLAWIAAQDPLRLHLSAVTIAEVEEGILRLPLGPRRRRLEEWGEALLASTGDRLIPVDLEVAKAWGALRARLILRGTPIATMDGFIAATADVFGLTVVTRNVRHFQAWGGPIINPWRAATP